MVPWANVTGAHSLFVCLCVSFFFGGGKEAKFAIIVTLFKFGDVTLKNNYVHYPALFCAVSTKSSTFAGQHFLYVWLQIK